MPALLPTMRFMRFIAYVPIIALLGALLALLWEFSDPPPAGRLDAFAASRIRTTCHFQSQCVLRVRDLFAGEWDTFYEFGTGVSQAEVDHTLRPLQITKQDRQRLLVLTRDGRLVTSERENSGTDTPLDGEIEFGDEHHREDHIVQLSSESRLQVTPFPTTDAAGHAGTFYALTPVE